MKHFSYFNQVNYPIAPGQSRTVATKNIMNRFRIRDLVKSYGAYFYTVRVQEGDRPDIISHKYYGSPDFAWLIYYMNDIVDPVLQWPLSYNDFNQYLIKKYGSMETAYQTIHAYCDNRGNIIDLETFVSLQEQERSIKYKYDYELEENEKKREIKLLDNFYLSRVLGEVRLVFQ